MSLAPNPKIVELLRQADADHGSKEDDVAAIVSIYNQVKALSKTDNLWYKRTVHPKRVCIHRLNRGEFGGSGWSAIDIGETCSRFVFYTIPKLSPPGKEIK